jgi:ABC-type nitrate/sulfonate/bicarbonate transport system substrate-binding protein
MQQRAALRRAIMKPLSMSVVAAAALFAISSGAGPASAAETMSAHLAQNLSPISGVVLVAEKEGFFTKHGLDISISNFTSGKQCLDTVMGGAADIATTAETPFTAAMLADQPVAFLARMEYSDDNMLTAVSAHINKFADLKGKRIGYTASTGSEITTDMILAKAKLTRADVTMVNLRPQDMVSALATGSIDAYDAWEPHIYDGKKALGAKVKGLSAAGIYSETFNIAVTQNYLKTHEKLLEKFLAAMIDTEAWMKTHRAAAIADVADTVGMKPADLAPIWNGYVYHVALDPKQIDVLTLNTNWRLKTGNHPVGVTKVPDLAKFVFPGPLRAVAPDRVTLAAGWNVSAR